MVVRTGREADIQQAKETCKFVFLLLQIIVGKNNTSDFLARTLRMSVCQNISA